MKWSPVSFKVFPKQNLTKKTDSKKKLNFRGRKIQEMAQDIFDSRFFFIADYV